jgi:hypothetical protein
MAGFYRAALMAKRPIFSPVSRETSGAAFHVKQ